jgi:hypothetical protein
VRATPIVTFDLAERSTMSNPNRSRSPAPTSDRIFVADLVEKVGLEKAAEQLDLSKLAVLNMVSGRGSYQPTIRAVQAARARLIA